MACPWAVDAGVDAGPAALVTRLGARDGLDGVIVPYHVSTWASVASVSGSQNVMSMNQDISMGVESAVQAGSRWPVAAYSMPRPRWQWAWSGRMPSASA